LNRRYSRAHPGLRDASADTAVRLSLLKDQLVANVRPLLWMLFGAVGFVLLIACANVASLLLARAASRSQEFALRAALGAVRSRLVRQLLAESIVLSAAGGALGCVLAIWAVSALAHFSALNLPGADDLRLDTTVLAFTVALSIATGVFFGLFPSLQISRPDLADVLRERGESAGRASGRRRVLGVSARGLLVLGQVALSTVLLIGAALLLESFARLRGVDPGLQPDSLLTMQIPLPPARYDTGEKRFAFFDRVVRRTEVVPGVNGVAVALTLPTLSAYVSPAAVAEQPPVALPSRPLAQRQNVTPGYFRTLKIPLRRGREFTAYDKPGSPPVLIVNESFARRFWPAYPHGRDPVGQHVVIGAAQSEG
ncbi:MAG: FtsX-like permease family protein, partial [Bryobacteraceae bacterium]